MQQYQYFNNNNNTIMFEFNNNTCKYQIYKYILLYLELILQELTNICYHQLLKNDHEEPERQRQSSPLLLYQSYLSPSSTFHHWNQTSNTREFHNTTFVNEEMFSSNTPNKSLTHSII